MQSGETAGLGIFYPKGYNNMWHVILQILAVIGIVLLVLLALLILTVLAVLFVPIRYRASGEKEADRIEGMAAVSFLYPLLSFKWQRAGNENRWALRLLGIKLKGSPKADKAKAAEPEKTEKSKTAEPEKTNKGKAEEAAKAAKPEKAEKAAEPVEEKEAEKADKSGESVKEEVKQPATADAETAEKRETAQQRTEETGTQKTNRASTEKKARFTISGLCDKMENIRDNVEYYKERLTAEENRLFLKRTKERIFAVLKSIKPKVLTARVVCGTGSPDTTGYVCAVYGMLYPVIEDRISFTADFENKVLDGELSVKGKVRVATLLRYGIKILLDKQLKVFLKEMKRED